MAITAHFVGTGSGAGADAPRRPAGGGFSEDYVRMMNGLLGLMRSVAGVLATISYLAPKVADPITGQKFRVDGGETRPA